MVLIPLMIAKSGAQRKQGEQHGHGKQGKKPHKKKKKR